MYTLIKFLLPVLTLATVISCNSKREVSPEVLGLEYTPLEVGMYWLYNVHSIEYNEFTTYQEERFESRVRVYDTTLNQAGDSVYLFVRESRPEARMSWLTDSVWQVRRTLFNYVETSENKSKVILNYPVKEGASWNINRLNADSVTTWTLISLDNTFTIDSIGLQFSDALVIEEVNIPDPIVEYDLRFRVFQEGVGEVFRFINNRVHCQANDNSCTSGVGEKSINYMNMSLKESGTLEQ
jgi:hypothetical protein